MDEACAGFPSFPIALDDYGRFGKMDSAILWQGVEDPAELEQLAARVRERLDSHGIGYDRKGFSAHITLMRRANLENAELEPPYGGEGMLEQVTLYESTLSPDGPVYRAVYAVELEKPYVHGDGPLLIIDADACPVIRESLAEARSAGVPVLLVGNATQNLGKHLRKGESEPKEKGFWAHAITAQMGADSADFHIVVNLREGDVVVTQDIGLASMVLGRGAAAIGVRGKVYSPATIDAMMHIRHEEKKLRRQGGRTGGPAAFTNEDRERFTRNLRKLLRESLQ